MGALDRERWELISRYAADQMTGNEYIAARQFCATAKARLQACSDFDANRQFLLDHV
jgi:hypothetical protein